MYCLNATIYCFIRHTQDIFSGFPVFVGRRKYPYAKEMTERE
jgi:hypothetical protein